MKNKQTILFTTSEAAAILGMSPSQIKNWTNGRPLKIVPSFRVAEGTGSRNLYSVADLYAFAVASRLRKDGIAIWMIQQILGKFRNDIGASWKYRIGMKEIIKEIDERLRIWIINGIRERICK